MDTRLPLYKLFTRLREAGLNLGMEQYLLALRLVGLPLQDKEHLRRLLGSLWVTSRDEGLTFDSHFNRFLAGYGLPEKYLPQGEGEKNVVGDNASSSKEKGTGEDTPFNSGTGANVLETIHPGPAAPLPQGVRRDLMPAASQAPRHHFVLTPTFAPVSEREVVQNWKYLRAWEEGRPGQELDIPAVVREVSRRGFFIRPRYRSQKVNALHVMLMVDQGGSMAPFHLLAQQIIRSALQLGKLQKENLLYFHDLPSGPLYRDPRLLHEVTEKEWMAELSPKSTAVMIFSDGGAARGSFSEERIYDTFQFFGRLRPRVHRLAWLNPVPEDRWSQCSAAFIRQFCPMFEANRPGMKEAIDYLLGKTGKGLL